MQRSDGRECQASERVRRIYRPLTSIPIADQITRELLPATGRRQLVGDPFRRRVRCDAKPQDLSPAVPHDQQSVEQSERRGRNDKQIHRRNAIGVIAEKRLSALRRWSSPAHHILGNAGLPNVDAELEQFAVDPGSCVYRKPCPH